MGISREVALYRMQMKEQGLSQEALAKMVGVSQSAVNQFLTGKSKNKRAYSEGGALMGDAIASVLGISFEEVTKLRDADTREEARNRFAQAQAHMRERAVKISGNEPLDENVRAALRRLLTT